MRLQKHERQAVAVIVAAATGRGVSCRVIARGKHPCKVVLEGPGGRQTIGISSSPRDRFWTVRVAERQALRAIGRIGVPGQ